MTFPEKLFQDAKVGEKFGYMDGSKSPAEFPQTPPEFATAPHDIALLRQGGRGFYAFWHGSSRDTDGRTNVPPSY